MRETKVIGKCMECGEDFVGINAYHIATDQGWFCSLECISENKKKGVNKI